MAWWSFLVKTESDKPADVSPSAAESEWDYLRARPDFDAEEMSGVRGSQAQADAPLAHRPAGGRTRSLRRSDQPTPWVPRSAKRKTSGCVSAAPGWVLQLEVCCKGCRWFVNVEVEALIGRIDEVTGLIPAIDLSADDAVSRQHALVYGNSGHFWVRDLFSTNGTVLNGQPVRPAEDVPLRGGDRLVIGQSCEIRVLERVDHLDLSEEDAALHGMLHEALGTEMPECLPRENAKDEPIPLDDLFPDDRVGGPLPRGTEYDLPVPPHGVGRLKSVEDRPEHRLVWKVGK